MFMYRLARDLGMLVEHVMELSTTEFRGWIAFYQMEAEEIKKASKRR